MNTTLYRICTEDRSREGIREILDSRFSGYTLLPAQGCWKGTAAPAITIEILPSHPDSDNQGFPRDVYQAAAAILRLTSQESVLVQAIPIQAEFVDRCKDCMGQGQIDVGGFESECEYCEGLGTR